MSYPIWVTPAGNLGIIPESEYFELVLDAYNEGYGYGARAVVSAVANLPPFNKENIGIITAINILEGGTGYPNGVIKISAEGGVGFSGFATVSDGRVVDITIVNGGYGYSVEQTSIVFNNNIVFSHIAGDMPNGIYVTKNGSLRGSPVVLTAEEANKQFKFTIRATNLVTNQVTDRSFFLTISNIQPPTFIQNKDYIGNYFDGSYFSFQLLINTALPASSLSWSIASGTLPPGLTLDANGLISGYIIPLLDQGSAGLIYYDVAPYSETGYDSMGKYRNDTYFFTIRVDDGITFGLHSYKMLVTSRQKWTGDTSIDLVNISKTEIPELEGVQVTADASNVYVPIITTPIQSLPDARSGANIAFKFDAFDPQYEDFNFSISSLALVGYDKNSSVQYDLTTANDILAFPCIYNGSSIVIQNKTYNTTNGKANIAIGLERYQPSSVNITSTYYVNNTLITYLTTTSTIAVVKGDTITQPSTGASGSVLVDSTSTTVKLINTVGTFQANLGNVFIGNIDGLGKLGNTYIFKNSANTLSAVNNLISSTVTYPTTVIYNPSGNVELYANTINFSGALYANISVTPQNNLPDSGVPYDTTKFDQKGAELPLSINIDPVTGWLTGHVEPQVDITRTYEFAVTAYKVRDPSIVSRAVIYYITVLGDLNNSIVWHTQPDLGLIDNGAISQLSISATAYVYGVRKDVLYKIINTNNLLKEWIDDNYNEGDSVLYNNFAYRASAKIVRGSKNPESNKQWQKYSAGSSLPNGLKLLDNGLIIGRTSFEYFSVDNGITTIDGNKTSFDNVHYFTVQVKSIDNRVSDFKTFKITINNYNRIPYENLYLKALPSLDQRKLFLSIVNDNQIFPEEYIYRPKDPWFGKAKDIKSLFLPGLFPNQISEYISAIQTNHFTKRINFGSIKTAVAVDQNFNTKYEVVYLELLDPVLDQGRSPANKIDLTNKINPWLDKQGNEYSVFYPNSLDPTIYPGTNTYYGNMKSAVVNKIGFSHQGSLPEWMTSVQDDGTVIGFTHAIVLAYTVPGASKLIAYRLKSSGFAFNEIDFVIDRYDLDNSLSKNFNTTTNTFYPGKDTTFDRLLRVSAPQHSVSYAVRNIPFEEIQNKTVDYVRQLGGLDGVTSFMNDELIVFAQQELYNNMFIENDGWNQQTNLGNRVVDGYLERLSGTVTTTLAQTAAVGDTVITVLDPAGIKIGYTVEYGSYFNKYTTVKEIIGNQIYLENRYSKSPVQPILISIPAGESLLFAPINQRAGVWKIKILDLPNTEVFVPIVGSDFGSDTIGFDTKLYNYTTGWLNAPPLPTQIVQLEFYSPVDINDKIQVNKGTSLSDSIIYYDPVVKPEKSVPEYSVLNSTIRSAFECTRFDSYQTRFISNRDSFESPTINDKYIKFPKFGVFK